MISTPEVDLDLNNEYLRFLSAQTQERPAERNIEQLGTTDIDFSVGIDTDPAGNVYLTGITNGSLQGTNQGVLDVWVAKYDSNGNQLWLRQFGTSSTDSVLAIVTDNEGNFYLTGSTQGDLFSCKQSQQDDAWVAKYDSNGNLLWG